MTALLDIHNPTRLSTLHPTAARTATGQGSAIDVRALTGLHTIVLDSAAGTGTTPTLDLTIQDSADGSTGWAAVAGTAFPQVAAVAAQQRIALNVGATRGFIRVNYAIGGTTPSFTFSANMVGRFVS